MNSFEREALSLLRQLTGNQDATFRDGQLDAIRTVADEGGSALVVQRTGWGKSAVYLIATRLIRDSGGGPTVIVSPLLALMRNQLQMTRNLGLIATTIDSTNEGDWEEAFEAIRNRQLDLLLISPERFNNVQFREEVMAELFNSIGLLVIDEVHCVSDWGHDFRPDYRRLRQIVEALPPGVPVLGTTATANDRVVKDVSEQLGEKLKTIRGTLERDSLSLQVFNMPNKAHRMAWLAETIPNLTGSGIVYCLTVRDAERVTEWLRGNGIDADVYTGPTVTEAKLEIEDRLTSGDLKVVVATSALSMGYDNPHIEFVIHYQTPGSPVAYYQQVGRAGRAVDHSFGIALSGWEDEDIQDYFINTAFPTEEDTTAILDALAQSEGLNVYGVFQHVNLRYSRIDAALKILEVEGAAYREHSRWFRSAQRWEYPAERVAEVTAARRREQEAMRSYLQTNECLMEFLRKELDDPGATPCGRCANCVGPAFSGDVDPDLVEDALATLNRTHLVIKPRLQLPTGLAAPLNMKEHRISEGRSLTAWGDPGLAEAVKQGKYRDSRYDDSVVDATASMIRTWGPAPRPTWITWVPSRGGAIEDFARRLGASLGLPTIEAVRRIDDRPPQKAMENSYKQAENIMGAFEVRNAHPGPVLLIDDMVDSRWSFTIIGGQLRVQGVEAVYPVALTDTSQGGS